MAPTAPPSPANPRRVLLARPHAFIVGSMTDFVRRNGFEPVRAKVFEDIASAFQAGGVVGVVISTAISAEIPRSFRDVFAEVRRRAPRVPIAVASMVTFEMTLAGLKADLAQTELPRNVIRLVGGTLTEASLLGAPDTVVVMSREDIVQADRLAAADRAITRHFRAPGS